MTNNGGGVFEALGKLLHYPHDEYQADAERCRALLATREPEAGSLIGAFCEAIRPLPLERLQELFTQTFDLNPVCSLEAGWQLYGEEYARGSFLVAMRGLLRDYGIEESCELPDHLTHLLPLLDRLEPDERQEFIERHLSPALSKMLAAFENKATPFRNVLAAVELAVRVTQRNHLAETVHG